MYGVSKDIRLRGKRCLTSRLLGLRLFIIEETAVGLWKERFFGAIGNERKLPFRNTHI